MSRPAVFAPRQGAQRAAGRAPAQAGPPVWYPPQVGPPAGRQKARLLGRAALGVVYPRRCPYCGGVIGFAPVLACGGCAGELEGLERPVKRLSPALHYFGRMEGAAAVYRYKGCARSAVHRVKYEGAAWCGPDLGICMAQKLFGCTFSRQYGILYVERSLAAVEYDAIVPVPASDRRRGYNVPLLLARPLSCGLGLPLLPQALVRTRFTRRQAGLPLEQRLENAAGAFAPAPGMTALLEGKRVLLVDDVITTGATAAACTQALLAAGAESVFAVALCVSEPE